jgi:hypothetical protein
MLRRDPASFRDPDGFVFSLDGIFYRRLTPHAHARLRESQLFIDAAVQRGLVLPFELDIEAPAEAVSGGGSLIRPERIELITYPHEWCFQQTKEAALATLDVNILALEHGLTLKDASAFNVQAYKGRMVLIDHTSFEETDGTIPWRPYSQFCRHFLNPLVIASYRDMHAGSLFRLDLDGVPQQTANDLLPWHARFVPSIAIHMYLHNRFIRRSPEFEASAKPVVEKPGRGTQSSFLKHLRSFIEGLAPSKAASNWANYYSQTNYSDATFEKKRELVVGCLAGRKFGTIWDVGANDGTFSRAVAPLASQVLALDLDHNAVNAGYEESQRTGARSIAHLIYNVCNPTPALGFNNAERSTLETRSKPDAIIALAVIHHLSITNNVPLDQSADYFADRAEELIIEFVAPEDSQVQRLLAQKNVAYAWYSEGHFQSSYSRRFELVSRQEITGSHRCIYHFKRRQ